jgi:hypothetical protein
MFTDIGTKLRIIRWFELHKLLLAVPWQPDCLADGMVHFVDTYEEIR